jgi:hypothetical protein
MKQHKAEIAHHVRGRLRMKVPAAKGNAELLEQIRRELVNVPCVHSVTANPDTGSLIVHYNDEYHADFHNTLSDHCDQSCQHVAVARPEFTPAFPPAPSRTEVDEMARMLEEEAEFLAQHSVLAETIVGIFKDLDRQLKVATNNNVDLKVVVPLGLAVYTFVQLGVEAATPVWLTLGLFALNHFVEMHAHPNVAPDVQRRVAPAF